jgi:hypothetical protein
MIRIHELAHLAADHIRSDAGRRTYVDWDSDQVDGSLVEVVTAVLDAAGIQHDNGEFKPWEG